MQRVLDHPILRWIAPILWMGVIFFLSAQSTLPNLTPGAPKIEEVGGHLGAYFVLAFLWQQALRHAGVRRAWLWSLAIAVLYGASDEFHQRFVPGRNCDVVDLSVDFIGASAALLAVAIVKRTHYRSRGRSHSPTR